jgi:hypothetical protein
MIAPQGLNLQINKGTDYTKDLELKNPDKTPFDLTGYTGVAKVRKFPEAKIAHDFTVGITSTTGVISLAMTVGVTTAITDGRNYYDVVITSGIGTTAGIGTVSKVFEGSVMVFPTVSV